MDEMTAITSKLTHVVPVRSCGWVLRDPPNCFWEQRVLLCSEAVGDVLVFVHSYVGSFPARYFTVDVSVFHVFFFNFDSVVLGVCKLNQLRQCMFDGWSN